MTQFEGRVAVIAGGGSGIGAATATLLAERGARVVVGDINLANALATVRAIGSAGGSALAVEFDISDEASVRALFEAATSAFATVDLLVNVAADLSPATLGPDSEHNVSTLPLDAWDRTLDVGLRGFVLTLQQALPIMVAGGGGAIVNITSLAAFIGEPVRVAYAASKAGINALTRHVTSAFGHQNIRCNSVAPGFTLTESARGSLTEKQLTSSAARNPSGRLGEARDIANVVAFLLSDDAAWVNGQVLAVDGGTTMR
jgi:NAD(P)-dependent dehydrogenase (short-subunit alcohol dehydrogenase family)